MHPLQDNYEDDIKYLKMKLDAGADFAITQLFYDPEVYLKWVKDCRNAGIDKPLIPGLMPIFGYDRFMRTATFCKCNIPQHLKDAIEPIKNDDEKIREFGVDYGVKMC